MPGAEENRNNERLAVIIPCYNEEATIAQVVKAFRDTIPQAKVFVYDNNSSDHTAKEAVAAGAVVRYEHLQGKGNVVRRMFADVEADIYVMVDGDDTYDISAAPRLIQHLRDNQLDMVNGRRVSSDKAAYRIGRLFGNKFLTALVANIFGKRFRDMLSGYRVLSRRFVKSFPVLATGFEIETELTVHALVLRMPVDELDTVYKKRPDGSLSKLKTFRDGFRIFRTIFLLVREERPTQFFSLLSLLLALASLLLAWPIFMTYFETGLVPRFPTAILSTGLMLLSFLSFIAGLILNTVTRGRQELKRLQYLQIPAVGNEKEN